MRFTALCKEDNLYGSILRSVMRENLVPIYRMRTHGKREVWRTAKDVSLILKTDSRRPKDDSQSWKWEFSFDAATKRDFDQLHKMGRAVTLLNCGNMYLFAVEWTCIDPQRQRGADIYVYREVSVKNGRYVHSYHVKGSLVPPGKLRYYRSGQRFWNRILNGSESPSSTNNGNGRKRFYLVC